MIFPSSKIFKKPSVIPGFGVTFGFTIFYLAIIVIVPVLGLFFHISNITLDEFIQVASDARLLHALKISFWCSFIAALINVVFGSVLSWVLVRYDFFGKKIVDAIIDLPFALPTAVAGISLATLYGPHGWIGQYFAKYGIKIAFTPAGIIVALVFIGLPFVVRTVQPVLEDLEKEIEEVATSLGANRLQIFIRIIMPYIVPALITGSSMAFVRALGEYGSVIFIAGNIPYVSELTPLIIMIKLEQYDYKSATIIAAIMLGISFFFLFIINHMQQRSHNKMNT